MQVTIVGGGIIGFSIGWGLARAGVATTLLDRCTTQPTSFIAAGMLAPYSETTLVYPDWLQIARHSLQLYPKFLQELQEDSGINVPLAFSGTLLVAIDHDDAQWLRRIYHHHQVQGIHSTLLAHEEALAIEPLLSPRVIEALWIPDEAHIDNRTLLIALRKAFLARDGKINDPPATPQQVVICAGAFSSQFGLPVQPIKGEMVLLKSRWPLRCMIRTPRVYLVPKPDNHVYIGATSVEAGYDLSFSAGALRTLLQEARDILPALDEMTLVECASGLRPVGPTPMPMIGHGKQPGVFYATGHGRAGILLAPYTMEKIMKLILNGEETETAAVLLSELLLPLPGHAAAVNDQVIPQQKWDSTSLNEGDRVEVVIPFQGG